MNFPYGERLALANRFGRRGTRGTTKVPLTLRVLP